MPFPLQPEFVQAAEAKLGRRLPPMYIAAMCRSNGGEFAVDGTPWWLHPIADTSDKDRLKRTWDDIARQTEQALRWEGFPRDGVSIADDGCGNRLVLLPDPDDAGALGAAVYVWDHETDELRMVTHDVATLLID